VYIGVIEGAKDAHNRKETKMYNLRADVDAFVQTECQNSPIYGLTEESDDEFEAFDFTI